MIQVACLLLAAGQSRRMEGKNKLLQDLGGRSVLKRTMDEISRAGFSRILAVTGYESPAVGAEVDAMDFPHVQNFRFSSGMHSSIRRGLETLMRESGSVARSDFFAVCLGDQPFLRACDYAALIAATRANPSAKLIVPVIGGQRGQPTLISMSLVDEILAHEDDDRGCRYLFEKYPALSVDLGPSAPAFAFHDVDTPAALALAREFV